jgi:excisionase family DNA binding protein
MEAHGFTDIDRDVVMARFLYREENRILVHGKGQFDDPVQWIQALERAKEAEQQNYADLTLNHGYPDTSSLSPREAHFARLSFLMTKYPQADWDLLMEDQESAMDRKPSPMPVAQVTVQGIEKTKKRFLALRTQRAELMTSGENPELLTSVVQAMGRNRKSLERWGISVADLIAGGSSSIDSSAEDVVIVPMAGTVSNGSEDPGYKGLPVVVDREGMSVPAGIPESKRKTISPREVADIMGIAYKTVLQHLESGQIPHGIKVGNRWVVQEAQFEQWFKGERREEEKPAVPPRVRADHRNPPRNPGDFRPSF